MRACLIIFLFLCTPLQAVTLKDRVLAAEVGDYVVTERANYSLLLIRQKSADRLILEEISTPKPQPSWKQWVEERAPGATSWVVSVEST